MWTTDITYIRMRRGLVYLVAILDWSSRHVLSWQLTNSLDRSFCLDALDESLRTTRPEIFNTNHGCQFTGVTRAQRIHAETTFVRNDDSAVVTLPVNPTRTLIPIVGVYAHITATNDDMNYAASFRRVGSSYRFDFRVWNGSSSGWVGFAPIVLEL